MVYYIWCINKKFLFSQSWCAFHNIIYENDEAICVKKAIIIIHDRGFNWYWVRSMVFHTVIFQYWTKIYFSHSHWKKVLFLFSLFFFHWASVVKLTNRIQIEKGYITILFTKFIHFYSLQIRVGTLNFNFDWMYEIAYTSLYYNTFNNHCGHCKIMWRINYSKFHTQRNNK